jgi:hypothetical protein
MAPKSHWPGPSSLTIYEPQGAFNDDHLDAERARARGSLARSVAPPGSRPVDRTPRRGGALIVP